MGTRFRDQARRDAAWGRYYRKRGLAPVERGITPQPNPIRRAIYEVRRALSQPIRC